MSHRCCSIEELLDCERSTCVHKHDPRQCCSALPLSFPCLGLQCVRHACRCCYIFLIHFALLPKLQSEACWVRLVAQSGQQRTYRSCTYLFHKSSSVLISQSPERPPRADEQSLDRKIQNFLTLVHARGDLVLTAVATHVCIAHCAHRKSLSAAWQDC
jgi:hypothetical protein